MMKNMFDTQLLIVSEKVNETLVNLIHIAGYN